MVKLSCFLSFCTVGYWNSLDANMMLMHCGIAINVTKECFEYFWIYSIGSSERGREAMQQRNIFPNVFIILFSEYFDFLPGFLFPCQHPNPIYVKRQKIFKSRNFYFISWDLGQWNPWRMSRWKPQSSCVAFECPCREIVSIFYVVTMFLGILENSSWGVMTTMGTEPGVTTRLLIGQTPVMQASYWPTKMLSTWH